MSGAAPSCPSSGLPAGCTVLFSPSHEQLRRAISRTGFSRTGCRCASRSSSTSICGATCPGSDGWTRNSLQSYCSPVGWIRDRAGDRARARFRVLRALGRLRSAAPGGARSGARVATGSGAREHRIMQVDLAGIGGSALTDATLAVPEEPTTGIPDHLRAGAQHHHAVAGARLGGGARRARHLRRRERARLERLSGLPAGVHCRLRRAGWRLRPRPASRGARAASTRR